MLITGYGENDDIIVVVIGIEIVIMTIIVLMTTVTTITMIITKVMMMATNHNYVLCLHPFQLQTFYSIHNIITQEYVRTVRYANWTLVTTD